MTAVSTERAYSAFEKQLRTLCLREFPCGTGSWRETKTKNLQLLKSKDNVDSRFSVTLKDFGADHEKTENLEEHVTSKYSPWHLDYSWSKEAKKLRELAVKSPWLIDDNFILSFFKTLRICDKNVTEVDENLLKFKALEELTLSANRIITVNSKNLPTSLKVLELCANQISDISALCVRPPPLIHLGLGSNKISFIGDYLTGDYWPNLLSLDLSHNNLSDLLDVIRKLGSLPKLRNLILQGNPLSLIPGYRGYTIDSLRKLSILDDIMISADEKHHYKGLARRREYILDEAKVSLEVTYIKGVPMPDELKNPEEQPEFPKIERKYFVQFMFPQDVSQKAEIFQICDDDFNGLSPLPVSEGSQFTPQPTSPILEEGELRVYSQQSQNTEAVKNVNFTAQPEVVSAREPTAEYERPPDEIPLSVTPKQSEEAEQDETMEAKTEIQLEAIKSEGGIWAEEIELNWSQVAVRDELLTLRNFLKQGMDFSVVEEMVLCYQNDDPSNPSSPTSKGKEGKDKKDAKKSDKKDEKGKGGKDDKKDDKKGGKKKKEPEVELKRMPPTYTTLAMWHIPLVDFLEGEYEFRSVFTQGGVEVASTIKSLDIGKKDKDKKKPGSSKPKKDEKGGKGSARSRSGGKTPSSVSSHGGRKMSAAGQKKDDKKGDKGKGGKAAAPAPEEEEDQGPPPPLEVQVAVRLHHWKTAMDSLKEEEEKNKAMAEEQQQG
ncbi:leucine-rich repeat-containing protein 43-like isoform X4 [Crassostrea angulata]|uniref:leucine-rich repeat-containing protein 43-like isoform X4 n=1 Tax=Magallana angulata TaxID=2784310 RepID=UPI0022B1FD0E|nr:leucine-rich repeat-containing protein 43-like isoform X4 [Crassostrea angulata]